MDASYCHVLVIMFQAMMHISAISRNWIWLTNLMSPRAICALYMAYVYALKGASLMFCQLKKEKIKLSVPHPLHAICCCAAVQATCRKQQTPQLWMEGRGRRRGVNCFVLRSYPIWGQGLNNFVSDCTATSQTISQQSQMQ